jgi:hypothetical protein
MIIFGLITFLYNSILAYFLCINGHTNGLILCSALLVINVIVICTDQILEKR